MTPAERIRSLLLGDPPLDIALTRSQERIAKMLRERLQEAVFMDAQKLAESVGTTPSTIVRFAQRLGFSGYPELRSWLADLLLNQASPVARAESVMRTYGDSHSFLPAFCKSESDAVEKITETLDHQRVLTAVEALKGGKRIFLFAEGPAACAAHLLTFRLSRLRHTVVTVTETGKAFFEKAALLAGDDTVLAFGLGRPSEELRAMLMQSAKVGARSILVTDNAIVELTRWATIVLQITLRPFDAFRSMVVPIAVAESLALALMLDDPAHTRDCLSHLEAFRREHGYPRIPRIS